ncbi:unnamed protein product [Prorocentrum cordatum]|uniref:ABC transporter domain-containing protein n=1 Tax=Prorocentrum cordatum TaxID=2364126 RepID=A0ABN9QCA3_9DINO|nr:unnamed protein product [Polarella glacialis]
MVEDIGAHPVPHSGHHAVATPVPSSLRSSDSLNSDTSPLSASSHMCPAEFSPLAMSSNIYKAIKMKRSLSIPVPLCALQWQDMSVTYTTQYGPVVTLRDCTGSVRGGELLALMGPSGAGKSTLLDTLTMRKTTGTVGGQVFLNGRRRERSSFLLASSYVPQEDNFVPTSTVLETMEFYASLTMPTSTSPAICRGAIEERLQSVGLQEKRLQRVGGRLPGGFTLRGLSGGERRRLSIAAGVVHSPALIFLDEPTSGLDAFSALCVIESLRAMANQGHAVACTIHQPRAAILGMFNKVAFLAAGRLVYLGDPGGIRRWLDRAGLWDPARAASASLTDVVLDCITTGFDKPEEQYGTCTVREESELDYLASHQQSTLEELVNPAGWPPISSDGRPGPWRQYCLLQRQQLRLAARSPATFASRMGLHVLLGLLIGAVYFDLDESFFDARAGERPWRWLPAGLLPRSSMPQDRVGVLFLLALTLMLTPMSAISVFIEDRQFFGREAGAGLYGAVPYHAANLVTELLICTLNALLEVSVAAQLVGMPLSGNRAAMLAVLASHHICSSALAQMCGRLSPNQDVAIVLTACYISSRRASSSPTSW